MITGIRLLQFTAITFYHNLARFSAVNIIIPANDFLQMRIFFADLNVLQIQRTHLFASLFVKVQHGIDQHIIFEGIKVGYSDFFHT